MREADINQDGVLSYAEFKLSLYRVVEQPVGQGKGYPQVGSRYADIDILITPLFFTHFRNYLR